METLKIVPLKYLIYVFMCAMCLSLRMINGAYICITKSVGQLVSCLTYLY